MDEYRSVCGGWVHVETKEHRECIWGGMDVWEEREGQLHRWLVSMRVGNISGQVGVQVSENRCGLMDREVSHIFT